MPFPQRLSQPTLRRKMFSGSLSGDPEKKAVPVASLAEDAAEERFSGALDLGVMKINAAPAD